ncbi:hypothetical protein GCM10023152_30270 [Agromyces bauzanensis]|uniref:Uncharacterized protein n=1 Tax=Agromyces bauzanensis TaxID=1308924 RepID=A0A917UUS0_9MICO|nr:hypothetical protein GCM10011372_26280 [Agromyces bauzanensis]
MDPATAAGTIAASDVAEARRWFMPAKVTRSGTMRMPPPTPKAPDNSPPAAPTSARRTQGSRARAEGAAGEVTRTL